MKLNDLLQNWKDDSKIDATDLSKESQRIFELHSKYLALYSDHRLQLKFFRLELDRLNLQKHEFFLQGPSKESQEKKWEYPASGKVFREDLKIYKDADKQIQDLNFKVETCQVVVDTLKYILDALQQRVYVIGSMVKREMYIGGGG